MKLTVLCSHLVDVPGVRCVETLETPQAAFDSGRSLFCLPCFDTIETNAKRRIPLKAIPDALTAQMNVSKTVDSRNQTPRPDASPLDV